MQIITNKNMNDTIAALTEGQHLFGEDIIENSGSKNFFGTTYEYVFEMISEGTLKNGYEYFNYVADESCKLFLDVDYKTSENYEMYYATSEDMLGDILTLLETFLLTEYEIELANFTRIVLSSCRADKFSYHIIFPTLIFKDMSHQHDFFEMFLMQFTGLKNIVDKSVYGKNRCLRLMGCSKKGNEYSLKLFDEASNYDTSLNPFEIFMLSCIATKTKDSTFINVVKKVKHFNEGSVIHLEKSLETNIVDQFLDALPSNYYTDYQDWLTIMFCLMEFGNEYLSNFIKFSLKSHGATTDDIVQKWRQNMYRYDKSKLSLSSLISIVKRVNFQSYSKINYSLFPTLKDHKKKLIIDSPFILMDRQKKLKSNDNTAKFICEFLDDNEAKCLSIKSAYGTGKSNTLNSIINRCDIARAKKREKNRYLIVSYRITLTANLLGEIEGFTSYKKNINADKLICQYDSLCKIICDSFDVIIWDESESILNHVLFPDRSYQIFQQLITMSKNASKNIFLDGDMGERSLRVMEHIGTCYSLVNVALKTTKHFIFQQDEIAFIKKIFNSLALDQKIYIPSMESSFLDYLESEIHSNFPEKKIMKHHQFQSDDIKNQLCDVNTLWTQYDVVMTTPTIESAVNFSIANYFDKVFFIMSINTNSARAGHQQIARVRYPNDPNVETLCKSPILMRTDSHENVSSLNDVILANKVEKYTLFDQVAAYADLENRNKLSNNILTVFCNMCTEKGYTFEIKHQKCNPICIDKLRAELIASANDITFEQLTIYEKLQSEQQLTDTQKYEFSKACYKKIFAVDVIDADFMAKYYGKIPCIRNLRFVRGDIIPHDNSTEIAYEQRINRLNIIKNIINLFGGLSVIKTEDELDPIRDYMNHHMFDDIKSYFIVDKRIEINTNKSLIGLLKTVISKYGLSIKITNKRPRINGKQTYAFFYQIIEDEIISQACDNIYINLAHGENKAQLLAEANLGQYIDYFISDTD